MRLVLASWNVHGWVGQDGRCDVGRSFDVISRIDADVFALQEVRGADWQPQAEAIGYRAILGATQSEYGNALLLRLPAVSVRRVDLSVRDREPRGALDTVLRLSDGHLRVVATHLGLRGSERRRQSSRLARHIESRELGLPIVLLGDLNDWTPWARELGPIARAVGPLSRAATFPSRRPFLALDRVACRLPGSVCEVRAVACPRARSASDHLPLRVDVQPARDRDDSTHEGLA